MNCARCDGIDWHGKPRDGRVVAFVCSIVDGTPLRQAVCLDCANEARAQMLHTKRGVPGEIWVEIIEVDFDGRLS
jgi:hypothetical protein